MDGQAPSGHTEPNEYLTQPRRSTHLRAKAHLSRPRESQSLVHQLSSPTSPTPVGEAHHPDHKRRRSDETGRKHEVYQHETDATLVERPHSTDQDGPGRKRRWSSPAFSAAQEAFVFDAPPVYIDTIEHWVREGTWPREYFEPDPATSLVRVSARAQSTLGDQEFASESTPFLDRMVLDTRLPTINTFAYEGALKDVGIHMHDNGKVAPSAASVTLCRSLLDTAQPVPVHSLFNDDVFSKNCEKLSTKNEARVARDLSPLLVPSAEHLFFSGATHLEHVIESVDQSWRKCVPILPGARPQPDISLGLTSDAFTSEQNGKLRLFQDEQKDASRIGVNFEMLFPFLIAELKCGNGALHVADRHNAHIASVAVNAIVEIYRAISLQDELNQEVLAFSISHDHRAVRIYGHYPVIDGQHASFYRYPISSFDITNEGGKDRWKAYTFTRNVYDTFLLKHLERVLAAIDELPDPAILDVEPLS